MDEINNDDIVKLYEDILNHIKYLKSNIIEDESSKETSEDNE